MCVPVCVRVRVDTISSRKKSSQSKKCKGEIEGSWTKFVYIKIDNRKRVSERGQKGKTVRRRGRGGLEWRDYTCSLIEEIKGRLCEFIQVLQRIRGSNKFSHIFPHNRNLSHVTTHSNTNSWFLPEAEVATRIAERRGCNTRWTRACDHFICIPTNMHINKHTRSHVMEKEGNSKGEKGTKCKSEWTREREWGGGGEIDKTEIRRFTLERKGKDTREEMRENTRKRNTKREPETKQTNTRDGWGERERVRESKRVGRGGGERDRARARVSIWGGERMREGGCVSVKIYVCACVRVCVFVCVCVRERERGRERPRWTARPSQPWY